MGLGRLILSTTVVLMTLTVLPNLSQARTRVKPKNPSWVLSPARMEKREFDRAMDAFDREDYKTCHRILLALVRQRPSNALYHFNLGNTAIKLQLWVEAMRAYEQVVVLKSPLSAVAGVYLSKAARGGGKLEQALHWMQWVKRRSLPDNLEALARDEAGYVQAELMAHGLAAYEAEALPRAITAFDKVRTLDGDPQLAGQAELMKGLALLRMDKGDQAHAEFEALMNDGASVQGIQQYVRYFSRLDKQAVTVDPPRWLALEVAMSYNSNLYADSDPVFVEGRTVVPWFLGGGVRVFKSGLYSINLGDNLSGEEVLGLTTSRYLKNSAFAQYKLVSPVWQLQLQTQLDYSALGGEPYATRPSLSIAGQRIIERDRFGLTLTASYQSPESDAFSYIRGSGFSARAFVIHKFDQGAGGPFLFINRENAGSTPLTSGTVPLGYSGYGPGFSGYLNPVQGWEVSGSISYAFKSYVERAQPGNLERTDHVLSLYARVARRVSRHFAPYISLDGVVNSSSLGVTAPRDKNYSQFIVATGVSWDLL